MGKQMQLYMTYKDELEFINFVYENNDKIVDEFGNVLIAKKESIISLFMYYIVPGYVKDIIKYPSGRINQSKSDVIEIWRVSTRDENKRYIILDIDNIINLFDNNRKSIYAGRIWVELKYWKNDDTLVSKNQILNEKYNIYTKYIKKNFIKSINPMYYFGKDAYNLCKKYNFKLPEIE